MEKLDLITLQKNLKFKNIYNKKKNYHGTKNKNNNALG